MDKIIVTGATSFIGSHLVSKLIDKGYFVFAVVRPNSSKLTLLENKRNIQIVQLDMKDYDKLDQMIDVECDCFCSLAWDGTRGENRDDSLKQERNYIYSIDGLNAALRLNCKRIISAGSQAEYGKHEHKITEEEKCNPNTEYGKWKLKFYEEAYEICIKKGINFKEPRFFSLYGPRDDENTMIISIMRKMLENKECDLTECTQMWDYLYIEDAIEAVVNLLECDCSDGAYNLGSDCGKPLREYVEEIKLLLESKSNLNFGAVPYPKTGALSIQPDSGKLRSETKWSQTIDFQTGIRNTLLYTIGKVK